MSDEYFNDPQDGADDPFLGSAGEYSDTIGATSPIEAARAPNRRRAIWAIGGATLVTVVLLLRAGGGASDDASVAPPTPGAQTAPPPTSLVAADSVLPQTGPASSSSSDPFLNPTLFAPPGDDAPPPSIFGGGDLATSGGLGTLPLPGAAPTLPVPAPAPSVPSSDWAGFSPAPSVGGFTPDELDRQASLDARREEEELRRARDEARTREIAEREAFLRQTGTELAAGQVEISAPNVGTSRLGGASGSGASFASLAAGVDDPSSGAQRYDLLPGTRVAAILTSEFDSGMAGGSRVEARLTQPLRDRAGRIILPAGTRAYGSASGSPRNTSGKQGVEMSFTVFVTPQNVVIRDLAGQGGDPETGASMVPARMNARLVERTIRGAASTAVGLALTQNSRESRSVFEQPSLRDVVIMDTRLNVDGLLRTQGGALNESGSPVTLHVDRDSPFILLFGL
jgi:hypothetical protein